MSITAPEWAQRVWYWWNEPIIAPRRHQIIAYIAVGYVLLRWMDRIVSVFA